jgi:hypothetical protein
MKKFFAFVAAAFMAISASAQSEAGSFTLQPNVGVTYTTATGDWGKDTDGGFALTAGVEGMYMINDKFGAALGLNFTGYNTSVEIVTSLSGKTEDKIYSNYYFNIPVTANYYVAPGLALKAGIAINFLSTAKIDGYDEYEWTVGRATVGKTKVKDLYKSTFFTVPVGASYEINDFVFDLRYNFGISKVSDTGIDGSFNALSFTVGYKF